VIERVPAVAAPEAGVRLGRVRVRDHAGHEEIRTVEVGEGADAWPLFARELRFALDNTRFVSIGDGVYRSETIDRIEPVTEDAPEPIDQALQACLAALKLISEECEDAAEMRELAHAALVAVELHGLPTAQPDSLVSSPGV
jgi:hypothetical protein